jgi:hypothetical protein
LVYWTMIIMATLVLHAVHWVQNCRISLQVYNSTQMCTYFVDRFA